MRLTAFHTLVDALGVVPGDVVAFVGGGGKTQAVQALARELSVSGAKVMVATTTSMYLHELREVGPVVFEPDRSTLVTGLRAAFVKERVVGIARGADDRGKVVGIPPDWICDLRQAAAADYVVVEADGSKKRPLKAFASHEPAIPEGATLIVHVAGLDAIGMALAEPNVHRPELLAADTGVTLGSVITEEMLVRTLALQRLVFEGWPSARVVTLLNKADGPAQQELGRRVACGLLAVADDPGGLPGLGSVIVGSLQQGTFTRADVEDASGCEAADLTVRGRDHAPLVGAIVLAAGSARRMGAQKLLLPFDGRPLVRWAVDAARRSSASETVVVVGSAGEDVRAVLAGTGVRAVTNPDHEKGMSASLKTGIMALPSECDAAVVVLGDQPLITSDVIDRLIEAHRATGALVVRPSIDGRPGHPVLLDACLFPEILREQGDIGGRKVIDRYSNDVLLIPIESSNACFDVDTPADYEALLRNTDRELLSYQS